MTYRILAAIDHYIGDRAVFEQAFDQAKAQGQAASLVLFHTRSSTTDPPELELFQLWQQDAKSLGLNAELEVVDSENIGKAICDRAKTVDLVLVGRRKRAGLQQVFQLGSVSNYVVHHALCPVVVVHRQPKILVAVDNYRVGEQVFDQAVTLAKAQNAQLLLVHVQSPEDNRQTHMLLKLREFEAQAAGMKTASRLKIGRLPGSAICDEAKAWGADLVVLGRRGHSGFRELQPGSVSQYVMDHAPCPTILVHHPVKILVALACSDRFSKVDELVFEKALGLAKNLNAKILLLDLEEGQFLVPDKGLNLQLGGYDHSSTMGLPGNEGELLSSSQARLQSYQKRALDAGVQVEFTRRPDIPFDNEGWSICHSVAQWGIDLIVVGRSYRGDSSLLGRVSDYVIHHATCSVIAVNCLEFSIA